MTGSIISTLVRSDGGAGRVLALARLVTLLLPMYSTRPCPRDFTHTRLESSCSRIVACGDHFRCRPNIGRQPPFACPSRRLQSCLGRWQPSTWHGHGKAICRVWSIVNDLLSLPRVMPDIGFDWDIRPTVAKMRYNNCGSVLLALGPRPPLAGEAFAASCDAVESPSSDTWLSRLE